MTKGSTGDGVVFHAGFPNAAEDERFGSLSLDELVVRRRASTFFWRLENDVPELLWSAGSILVVDRSLTPHEGSLAVVMSDDEFILARFRSGKLHRLQGAPLAGGADEAGETSVWGIVTYCLQPLQGASLQQGGSL